LRVPSDSPLPDERYFAVLEAGFQPVPGHRLTRRLGAGAFGEVWEAIAPDGRAVALKFLDCRSRPASMISREVRTLRGLSELRHPHIIHLEAVHASSRYLILVMERADGNLADLHDAYREEARTNVTSEHALELIGQAAEALDFMADLRLPGSLAASRGLQHCDVKPSNLLLVGDVLKVADFGLCSGTAWHAQGGGWRGTPPYAAPELYQGNAYPGTDQYALAITFCELVMGDRPFWPGHDYRARPAIPPIDLTKLRQRELPVLSRALMPSPSDRWPSCKAFVEALVRANRASRRIRRSAILRQQQRAGS
jgi:serine/threonine protein kinase